MHETPNKHASMMRRWILSALTCVFVKHLQKQGDKVDMESDLSLLLTDVDVDDFLNPVLVVVDFYSV